PCHEAICLPSTKLTLEYHVTRSSETEGGRAAGNTLAGNSDLQCIPDDRAGERDVLQHDPYERAVATRVTYPELGVRASPRHKGQSVEQGAVKLRAPRCAIITHVELISCVCGGRRKENDGS